MQDFNLREYLGNNPLLKGKGTLNEGINTNTPYEISTADLIPFSKLVDKYGQETILQVLTNSVENAIENARDAGEGEENIMHASYNIMDYYKEDNSALEAAVEEWIEDRDLNESKRFKKKVNISEYFTPDPESTEDALFKAGVDVDRPIYVAEATSNGPGGTLEDTKQMEVIELLTLVSKEKQYHIQYDYEAADAGFTPEEVNAPEGTTAKLSIMFEDAYEYIIFQ